MIQPELKTSTKQRVIIILIAILMVGSTIALYMGIVLSYNSASTTSQTDTEKQARLQELMSEYQTEVDAQAAALSAQYFDIFAPYKSEVKAFNAANITELKTTDLKIGDGTEITEGSTDYSAYYIGWLSDETIFDSSLNDPAGPTALLSPLAGGQMIEGWNQGIIGMKIGGIREISIPSELAYGDQENGTIPANSPLKFVIMLIPPAEEIPYSDELLTLYEELYGSGY